jgi:DNA-binding PadR family transcriptional regulator
MTRLLDPKNFVADKLAWHQQIAMDPAVSPSAKAVAGLILHDLNEHRGGAWRGQKSMASCLHLGERQLRRLLNELEKAGYLQIEGSKGRGRTNIYRATRPSQSETAATEPAENRSSASAQTKENRSQRSDQSAESRTSETQKADMGDRQYLYDSIRSTRTRPRLFEEAQIRSLVVGLAGEEGAVSYLDPTRWDSRNRRIICRSRMGHDRLKEKAGRALFARGVTIVLGEPLTCIAA